ncbi:hypothetical protein EYF80_022160 [Liparis tanakae]|uniref:Uncharacterized protein n=1 Tax=Liparis tanakae TaxID=230148 RepID=A0A4Z2HPT6_9TELE|nr:hypothetical protein EYF80_022160 [Liparis tanakae]
MSDIIPPQADETAVQREMQQSCISDHNTDSSKSHKFASFVKKTPRPYTNLLQPSRVYFLCELPVEQREGGKEEEEQNEEENEEEDEEK